MNTTTMLLAAWLTMAALMFAAWLRQRATKNAGICDVIWSYGTAGCAAFFAFMAVGDPARRWLVALLVVAWGVRLGTYLAWRVARDEHEDARYLAMRQRWAQRADRNMLIVFQVQAAWCVLFALPMFAAASNDAAFPRWSDGLGLLVWCASIGGEWLADRQLARFRADPANRGQVCQVGLWRYTRHPNYFAEWLQWWAWLLLALGGERWWLAAAGVVVMYIFLNHLTGIRMTEKRLLESRGEAYRRYQRTTSAFFPWFPKREPSR